MTGPRNRQKKWMPEPQIVHLTPEAIAARRGRLAELKKKLPELAAEAGRTAAFGDRSENAEYQAAKRELRRAKNQIARIEFELKMAQPIPHGAGPDGRVQIGSTVVIQTPSGVKTYRLVGPQETNPERGHISQESPLGKALLGRQKGETITLQTPTSNSLFEILDVK